MIQKNVLITGASRGIGFATAHEFARNGFHVIINCLHSNDKLYKLKEELEETYHTTCLASIGDIGDETYVTSLFSQISDVHQNLDVLVNNAGISMVGLLSDMPLNCWNEILSTNLTSAFLCSKAAIQLMLPRKSGRIINVSSIWGNTGASCEVAYSAAKGGLNTFTKALAKELAPSNIQVNAIACGAIDTDMNNQLSSDEKKALIQEIPSNRMGTPEEAAKLIYSIAISPFYLTGQIIGLDGGWS